VDHVLEDAVGIIDDLAGSLAFDVGHEPHAATVFFVGRVIKPVSFRQTAGWTQMNWGMGETGFREVLRHLSISLLQTVNERYRLGPEIRRVLHRRSVEEQNQSGFLPGISS
jgi:hypothetical protein